MSYNVNGNYVNKYSENNPISFGSNEICGGAKRIKKKIKNITRKYKMKLRLNKRSIKRLKNRLRTRFIGRNRSFYGGKKRSKNVTRRRMLRGGNQFMTNMPNTPSYSLGGVAASSLANPPPFNTLSNCTNCIDNYNHYTKMGTPS